MTRKTSGKYGALLIQYLPILILLAAWEMVVRFGIVNELLLPPFSRVMSDLINLTKTGEMLFHTLASLWRGFVGLLLSILLGGVLGICMAWYRGVRDFFDPIVNLIYPLPKLALIPIVMIWLGDGDASKILVIILGSVLPVIINSYNGVRGIDHYLIWSAENLGTRKRDILWKVAIPAALPDILSGIRVAIATTFLMLVGSEMLGGNKGLGYLIFFLGESGIYSGMFASVITITLIGFLTDQLYVKFMNRVLIWKQD